MHMLNVDEISTLIKARDVCDANGLLNAKDELVKVLQNSALDVTKGW